jgi:hypothetical protein
MSARALDLRLQFLTEAESLHLIPLGFGNTVIHVAARSRDEASMPGFLADVCNALLDPREGARVPGLISDAPTGGAAVLHTSRRAATERIGRVCEGAAPHGRKKTGTYYTPGWVADLIARTVLRGVLEGRGLLPDAALSLRLLDPAAGAGAFLVAMVDAIAEVMGEDDADNTVRRAVVAHCIRGIDLDPLAAEACRLSLWLTASRPGRPAAIPAAAVSVRDTLLERPRRRSVDIVVGNPPWGVKLTPSQAAQLSELAPDALRGHRDSFLFFLALGAEAVRGDGAIGLVLPDALLSQVKYEAAREHLLASFRPLHVARFGDRLFPGATAPACALCLIGKSVAPHSFVTSDLRGAKPRGLAEGASWAMPSDAPTAAPHHSFLLPPPQLDRLLRGLCPRHRGLGEPFRFHDSGINYATADLGRALLYTGARQYPEDIPVTRGRDFAALTVPGSSAWLRHDWRCRVPSSAKVSVRADLYGMAPKLLFRQTGDRPMATVDRAGVYFGRSVIAVSAPSERDLLWLAAVMNSGIFAALYRALTPEVGRPFAQVKVSKLKLVPVPPRDADDGPIELARELLRETGEERRGEMLAQVDDRVAEAYGLSAKDRRTVAAFVGPRSTSRAGRGPRADTS